MAAVTCGAAMLGGCGNENLGGGTGGAPGTGGAVVLATGGTTGTGLMPAGSGGMAGALGGGGGLAVGGAAGHGIGVVSGTGGCNAISLYPPVVTVVDATSGAPICDATFVAVSSSGSLGAVACDGATTTPCAPAVAIVPGDSAVCRFELEAFTTGSGEVLAGAPGYLASTPFAVYGGEGGCVPYVAAAQVIVALTPEGDAAPADADAATDAH